MSRVTSILTPDEQQLITEAVHGAEQITSGEIVPMIVSRCHHYPVATLRGAALFSTPLALLLPFFLSHFFWFDPLKVWAFLGCFIPLFFIMRFVIEHTPLLHRLFVSSHEAQSEVEEEAMKAFYTYKLHKTEAENGILLFISIFEKRVCVLADTGINNKIPQEKWDEVVSLVTKGMKKNRVCEGICDGIAIIGQVLHTHFPSQNKDKNELHDFIIRE